VRLKLFQRVGPTVAKASPIIGRLTSGGRVGFSGNGLSPATDIQPLR
jgi:hypothetical protein